MRTWIRRHPGLLKFAIFLVAIMLFLEKYDQDIAYFILLLAAP